MQTKSQVSLFIGIVITMVLLFLAFPAPVSLAQTPRPTPTNEPIVDEGEDDDEARGAIRGNVYRDVNGDGRCINTGVEGEGPMEGISVEFVSSDEETVLTLTSGPDGQYGLFAAGHSFWAVTAKPGADWVVTSEKTQYAPIYPDSLVVTDVNFCVQKASVARVVLPASGAPHVAGLSWVAFVGVGLFLLGLGMSIRERVVGD